MVLRVREVPHGQSVPMGEEIISLAVFEMCGSRRSFYLLRLKENKKVLSEHRCKALKGHRGDFQLPGGVGGHII